MYAVIVSGGKQYRVVEGQVVRLEKLNSELGSKITFDQVLLVSQNDEVQIGSPAVKNCKVIATVHDHGRDKKINILKFKRRKHHMKRMGHRQSYTEVVINKIERN